MLSIRAFSSAGAAAKYYSHGDYYGQEGQGTWLGEGARELGFKGEFTASSDKNFNNLLNGILPNGQVLGKKTKDGIKHRPGIDLTFSAPKSFSIEMLVFASKEQKADMEKALMNATSRTLSYIEKKGYAVARKGQAGKDKEPINKLSFASFYHTTNRNLEPQAHVHCFLANAAKCGDDKYRSLEFKNILKDNKFLGQIFRNELAMEVKKLDIAINTTFLSDGSSSFELSHIDQKLIDGFSTRRAEIEALCKIYGVTTKEGRDKIVINSRKAKQKIKEEDLKKSWNDIVSNIEKEIDLDKTSKNLQQESNKTTKSTSTKDHHLSEDSNIISLKSVTEKISQFFTKSNNKSSHKQHQEPINTENDKQNKTEAHLDEYYLKIEDLTALCIEDVNSRKSVFTEKELAGRTLKYTIGNYGINDIEKELNKQEESGVLIRNGAFLTTKALLETEKQVIKYTENSIGKSKEILKEQNFDKQCKNFAARELAKDSRFKINDQQKNALKHILTSKDKIILMEGLPGTGKSTILNGVRDISGRKILSFIGFGENYQGMAPTASAAKSLGKSAKVESDTIHSFLATYEGYLKDRGNDSLWSMRQEYKNTIIFVDEASLIPTNIMHNLLKLQDKFGYKLVLTGDTKQLGAVEAGKPFEQMLEILPSVKVSEIIRQEDKKHKEAVVASSEGNVKKTFEIHDKNIIEAGNPENMADQAAILYLSGDQNNRDNTLLISPTRILRDNINNKIVESLRSSKQLQGDIIDFTALRQKDVTSADYKFAPSFEQGDVLKFYKSYKNGIEKGEYFRVKSVHQPSNTLVLTKGHLEDKNNDNNKNNKNQKEIFYQLRKGVDYEKTFEVFTDHPLKLQKGLKIIFTKNNREQGLVNSETAIIQDIGKNSVTVKIEESKKNKTIPLDQLKHIDNGYCITVHSSQGKTYDNTIAAIGSNEFLNNQKSWLVAISRHRNEITAIVEDKSKLESQITSNKDIETSAMELVATKEQSSSKSLQQPLQNDTIKTPKQLEAQI